MAPKRSVLLAIALISASRQYLKVLEKDIRNVKWSFFIAWVMNTLQSFLGTCYGSDKHLFVEKCSGVISSHVLAPNLSCRIFRNSWYSRGNLDFQCSEDCLLLIALNGPRYVYFLMQTEQFWDISHISLSLTRSGTDTYVPHEKSIFLGLHQCECEWFHVVHSHTPRN